MPGFRAQAMNEWVRRVADRIVRVVDALKRVDSVAGDIPSPMLQAIWERAEAETVSWAFSEPDGGDARRMALLLEKLAEATGGPSPSALPASYPPWLFEWSDGVPKANYAVLEALAPHNRERGLGTLEQLEEVLTERRKRAEENPQLSGAPDEWKNAMAIRDTWEELRSLACIPGARLSLDAIERAAHVWEARNVMEDDGIPWRAYRTDTAAVFEKLHADMKLCTQGQTLSTATRDKLRRFAYELLSHRLAVEGVQLRPDQLRTKSTKLFLQMV